MLLHVRGNSGLLAVRGKPGLLRVRGASLITVSRDGAASSGTGVVASPEGGAVIIVRSEKSGATMAAVRFGVLRTGDVLVLLLLRRDPDEGGLRLRARLSRIGNRP